MRVRAFALSLVIVSALAAACDDSRGGVRLIAQASFVGASARLSPNPIALQQLVGFGCSGGGFAFAPSFRLILTAGPLDLRVDHLTMRMLDGSNLGGPSITIPQSQFGGQTASMLIRAGATREFLISPDFGCFTPPLFGVSGNVFLFDSRGANVILPVEGRFR
jgi:hypothetical protein